MPSKVPSDDLAELEQKAHESRSKELIGKTVISLLGTPSRYLNTRVQEVWPNHYRVNVYVSHPVGHVIVAHSFFVTTDSEANILQSSPPIKRHY
jgi:hypothetical protein